MMPSSILRSSAQPYVWILPADTEACGHYRLEMPSATLPQIGMRTVTSSHLPQSPEVVKGRDVMHRMHCALMVTQRQIEPHQVEWVRAYADAGFKIVMDVDDLLWNPPGQSHFRMTGPQRKALKANLEAADHVVTTNAYLAGEVRKFCKAADVRVLPNAIRATEFVAPRERAAGEKLRVVYMGGANHRGDVAEILPAVRETQGEVEWFFFGVKEQVVDPQGKVVSESMKPPVALRGMEDLVTIIEPQHVKSFLSYCGQQNFHVALAPLEDHPFNRAKSDLKLLEAGAIGLPCIASRVLPYADSPNPLIAGGKRAWRDWLDAIRRYKDDEQARMSDAWALYNYSWERRFDREDFFKQILRAWLPRDAEAAKEAA